MKNTYPMATVAELIGAPARAAILVTLLDGSARTAGELALLARVSAQSASGHLSKLLDGGLLTVRGDGRYRYYTLAGSSVAHALEALGAIATKPPQSTAARPPTRNEMNVARTCYDHLAGRVAVELVNRLQEAEVLQANGARNFELGIHGKHWFANLGIDVDQLRRSRRCFARQCLDWTERRPHLAGILGAALCSRLIGLGWIARRRDTRAVRITDEGIKEFRSRLGLSLSADCL